MMREVITRYGRDNLGVLWMVGEPMIFTIGVATLWSAPDCHTAVRARYSSFCRYRLFIRVDVAKCYVPMQCWDRTKQAFAVPSQCAHH